MVYIQLYKILQIKDKEIKSFREQKTKKSFLRIIDMYEGYSKSSWIDMYEGYSKSSKPLHERGGLGKLLC